MTFAGEQDATALRELRAGTMHVQIYRDAALAGRAAAQRAAETIRAQIEEREKVAVIFATGASQFQTLAALTALPEVPWRRVDGFHMDEYVGLSPDHAASFRRYLRDRLTSKVAMRSFLEMDGTAPDPNIVCEQYAEQLRRAEPQLCLMGIGENGHLAFNDPPAAKFHEQADVKIVALDEACKRQQVAEGWFPSLADVPGEAITLTIPTLLRVPRLIVSVPGPRKAAIVRRAIHEAISESCPATILRTHPDATLYLDEESAAELN